MVDCAYKTVGMSESIRIDSAHLTTLRRIAKMQKIPVTRAVALAVEALEEQLEIRAINRAQTSSRRARDLKMLAAIDKALDAKR